jgi:Family of unknown function (DUF6118)
MENTDPDEVELDIATEANAKDDHVSVVDGDPAAEAFARLEGELALMRRAVQHLATERADIVIPDYSQTLVAMTGNIATLDRSLKSIGEMPALQITPEDMGKRIEQTARSARSDYEATIQQWRTAACGLERGVSEALGSAVKLHEQGRREKWFFGAGAAAAVLLMTFLPGIIARELPSSWQFPERMAQRILNEPTILDAGIHLVRMADPETGEAIVDAAELNNGNREAIKRCKAVARKAKRSVHCQVRIDL